MSRLEALRLEKLLRVVLERHFPAGFVQLARLRDRLQIGHREPEQALLPLLCVPTEVAVDVGANHGSYTVTMIRHALRVVAIEANPLLVRILRGRLVAEIRSGQVIVVEAALSNRVGTIDLFVPARASALGSVEAAAGPRPPGRVFRVRSATLDSLDLPRIGFLKIDVEGHEEAVVAGGAAVIARDLPSMLIEAEDRHCAGSLSRLRERLEALGYRGYFLQNGCLRPIADFDPAIMQDPAALNEAGTLRRGDRIYVNNFVFVAREGVHRALSDARWLPRA